MKVECVTDLTSLEPLRSAWNDLAEGVVFRTWEWLGAWWQAYASQGELSVLVVRDPQDQVVGIAPWYRERSLTGGRTLRFLGSGKACSEYSSLLVHADRQGSVAATVADWLVQVAGSSDNGWDQLDLEAVSIPDPVVEELLRQLQQRGGLVTEHPGPACWYVPLPSQLDELFEQLKPGRRSKLRSLARKYVASGQARLCMAATSHDVNRLFQRLVEFHQRRWAQAGIDGCFTDPRFEQFLRRAVDGLHADGHARLVSAATGWRGDCRGLPTPLGPRLCRLPMWDGPGSLERPARLAADPALHAGFDRSGGAEECDFLRGDERYKLELALPSQISTPVAHCGTPCPRPPEARGLGHAEPPLGLGTPAPRHTGQILERRTHLSCRVTSSAIRSSTTGAQAVGNP